MQQPAGLQGRGGASCRVRLAWVHPRAEGSDTCTRAELLARRAAEDDAWAPRRSAGCGILCARAPREPRSGTRVGWTPRGVFGHRGREGIIVMLD